jgi:short-subunit dehydrogenase
VAETALVTGASSGIGEQFAWQLSARGYELVLVARRADRLESLASELPTEAHVVPCDLVTEADTLHPRVIELGIDVDLLVNNAGFGLYGRFLESDPEREAAQVRLNCEAVVVLTRAFLPGMVEQRRGGVINMGSTSGLQPLPYSATYAATKVFVRAFTDALREELRGTGVRALCVNPGRVPTEWQEVAGDTRRVLGAIEADQVVRETLEAYDRGRRQIIPGRTVRWLMGPTRLLPRPVQLRVTERMYRPKP